jgi:large subunit ribosomal protein L2
MAIRYYKPTTPGQRGMTTQDMSSISPKTKPTKKLRSVKTKRSGRNNQGRITTRHRGGGVKSFYRNVTFNLPADTKAKIVAIEYDPNRSARIARISDQDGNQHYILASAKMSVGDTIESGEKVDIEHGNRLPLENIPAGSIIHAIELEPNRGAQIVRSAGARAQLIAKEGDRVQIKLPSGEVRTVHKTCTASLGAVGNEQHKNIKVGKAGRNRKKGRRPTVRGVVMNAVDHPHGGGDGGSHGPGGHPMTPWGQKTLGYRTRRRKRTNKFIVRNRHESKRR